MKKDYFKWVEIIAAAIFVVLALTAQFQFLTTDHNQDAADASESLDHLLF